MGKGWSQVLDITALCCEKATLNNKKLAVGLIAFSVLSFIFGLDVDRMESGQTLSYLLQGLAFLLMCWVFGSKSTVNAPKRLFLGLFLLNLTVFVVTGVINDNLGFAGPKYSIFEPENLDLQTWANFMLFTLMWSFLPSAIQSIAALFREEPKG